MTPSDTAMISDSGMRHRRSVRLPGYDYGQPSAYFITICTHGRACLFGGIENGTMIVNDYGQIANDEWTRTGVVRPYVMLDEFVVMPNHIHGILAIDGGGMASPCPYRRGFAGPIAHSLSTIVGSFKSAVAKSINTLRQMPGVPIWQRNYYEHVIRGEDALNRIREYVMFNPTRWETDRENPARSTIPPARGKAEPWDV